MTKFIIGRKTNEKTKVTVGKDEFWITPIKIGKTHVRLLFEAPREVKIERTQEIHQGAN